MNSDAGTTTQRRRSKREMLLFLTPFLAVVLSFALYTKPPLSQRIGKAYEILSHPNKYGRINCYVGPRAPEEAQALKLQQGKDAQENRAYLRNQAWKALLGQG